MVTDATLTKSEQRFRLLRPIKRGVHTAAELASLLAAGHDWRGIARIWGMRPRNGAEDLYWDAYDAWERVGCPGGPAEEPEHAAGYETPEWDVWRSARKTACEAWLTTLANRVAVTLERTPDGLPEVWLLYRREPFHPDGPEEREMNLWVRRCDVFSTRQKAIDHLDSLIGDRVAWGKYDPIFGELWVGKLGRFRWWLVSAPLDPPGGQT